ncbi:MAG TPA: hypothetical protein VK067_05560 [Pseudogracilibacillus sp.]|nr:hypothetical protein [Pseudogracilibacillus sp.]
MVNFIRIIVGFSIVSVILYKTLWKKKTSLASLVDEAKSLTATDSQDASRTDSTGPIGTFGMS